MSLVEEFRAAAAAGDLLLQRCSSCRSLQYPPSSLCRSCLSAELTWEAWSGTARLYSFTEVHRAFSPDLEEYVPYVLAMVELEPGVWMETWLVGCSPEKVHVGMLVEIDFQTIAGNVLPIVHAA